MNRREELILQHIPRLQRYARALVQDSDRAEDLVQETLARALGRLGFWQHGTDMRAWLFSIMHNQFVNECRRAGNRPDSLPLEDHGVPEPVAGTSADQRARLMDIEAALARLPEEQRTVLLLVSLEGLSYRQTAKVLGIKAGTMMSRLHRGREQLRRWLNEPAQQRVQPIRRVK